MRASRRSLTADRWTTRRIWQGGRTARGTRGRRRAAALSPRGGQADLPASGSTCCSIPGRSRRSTSSSRTAARLRDGRSGDPGRRRRGGHGRVGGRPAYAFAQDFTVFGGGLSETNAAKIAKVMDLALAPGVPIVGLNDSGGARIQEGVLARRLRRHLPAQHARVGRHPPDLAIMGPCAGGHTRLRSPTSP